MSEIRSAMDEEFSATTPGNQPPLCEVLDRVLNKGVVLTGEIVISVADVALLYVSLSLVLSSVETLLKRMGENPRGETNDVIKN